MCRSDLSSMVLQLKALGIHNVLRFSFPTPPPAKCLLAALEVLYALDAIDKDGMLTDCGTKMAELPLKPMCAKILCNSGEYGCIDEALSIAAMLQVDNVFTKSKGKDNIAARISRRNNFEVAEGDIIMYLNILDSYLRIQSRHGDEKRRRTACKDWCQRMYLNYRILEKACEIRSGLEKLIKGKYQMENKVFDGLDLGSAKCERVMKCVTSALFPALGALRPRGHYRAAAGARLHVATRSCLHRLQQPQWVVFASVQTSGDKTYMQDLMVVQKEWLLEVAPHYYKEI